MVRLLKALALVVILSIASLYPAWDAPESGLVQGATLGTFSNGNQSVNITFYGPGEDSSVSVRLPARVNVTTAALQAKGTAVEREGSLKNATAEEFRNGTSENLAIGPDGVRLDVTNLTWTSTTDEDLRGESAKHVNISDGAVTNNMSGFMRNYRIDPNGQALNQQLSSMVIAENGTIFVSWVDSRGHGWSNFPAKLYIARSEDGGNNFRNETLIWGTPDLQISRNAMAIDGNGIIHVVFAYFNGYNQPQIINYTSSIDGGRSFAQSVTIGYGLTPSIGVGPGGWVHVVWGNFTNGSKDNATVMKSSSDGGLSWGSQVRVDGGNGNATMPDVAVDVNGKVHVIWMDARSGGGTQLYYANSTDHGATFSLDKPIGGKYIDSRPRLTVLQQNLHLVFSNSSQVNHMRSPDGGATFNAPTVVTPTGTNTNPVIAIGPTGRINIVWIAGVSWGWGRPYFSFSTDGTTFSPQRKIDDSPSGVQTDPSVCVDNRENVHAVWTDSRNSFWDIWYSRFPSVGMVVSNPKDLGMAPMAYTNLSWTAMAPQGTEVTIFLHSSPNGQDWTDWDMINTSLPSIPTKPDRYVQWMLFLWANVTSAPIVYDITLTYEVGRMNGSLTSLPTVVGTLYSARVYWNATMNGQDFDIEVSPNNGTTWKLVGQVGGLMTFAGITSGSVLQYRVKWLSTIQGASAVLKDISISYLTSELPTDLEIIMTGAGDPDWTFTGPFEGTEMVSGFGEKLSSYLANATPDSEDQVTVPVKVRCKSPGKLDLRNLNLKYSAPPDAPALMEPVNGSIVSTSMPTFSMNGSEPDGDDMMFRIEVFGPAQQSPIAVFDQKENAMNGKWNSGYFSPGEKATFTPSADFALPDGNLTWQALAYDTMFWSKPSKPWTLVVDTTPPWGSVVDDGAETDSHEELHASFMFTDNTSGIAGYEYSIGTSQGANDTHPVTATDEASVTVTGLEMSPGGTYYFTVRAGDRAGLWSPWASSDGIKVSGQGPTVGLSYPNGVQAEALIDLTMDLKDPMGGRVDDVDLEWSLASYANGTMGDWAPWTDVGDASGGDSKVTGHTGDVGKVYRFRARGHNDRGIWGLFETPASTIRIDRAPMLDAGPDQQAKAGDTLQFNASAMDEDGDALNITWYFPDDESTQSGPNVSHVFSKGGDWEVEVTVTDGTMKATRTVLVKVEGKKSNTGKVPGLAVTLVAAAIAVAAIIVASARSRRS